MKKLIHPIQYKIIKWKKTINWNTKKYISLSIALVFIIALLFVLFFANSIINSYLKQNLPKELSKAFPNYSIQLDSLHYNVMENSLNCKSIIVKDKDSSFTYNANGVSVSGIGWLKLLWDGKFSINSVANSIVDIHNLKLIFHKDKNEYYSQNIHLSIPNSELTADSIKHYSTIDDESFFANSKFRQTRFLFDMTKLKISGINYASLIKSNTYIVKKIFVYNLQADILVNMDKPYNKNSINPQMPNEFINSINQKIILDSLKIMNGLLNYSERFAVRAKPGTITFSKVNILATGISNINSSKDTAIIHAKGLFMNRALMKLYMVLPLDSNRFSMHYSGTLAKMDATIINKFVEAGEHRRIKSGIIKSASFHINVKSGKASGTLNCIYDNLNIAILNEKTGSEKGIFNIILSFIGKVFVIKGSNLPDENGSIRIGHVSYIRMPDNYFLQFVWFALRSSIADLVGFPKEEIINK